MYRRGYSHEDIQRLGVDLEDADQLNQAEEAGASAAEFDDLVTDDMVAAIFIACLIGNPRIFWWVEIVPMTVILIIGLIWHRSVEARLIRSGSPAPTHHSLTTSSSSQRT